MQVPARIAGTSLNHMTVFLTNEDGEKLSLMGDRSHFGGEERTGFQRGAAVGLSCRRSETSGRSWLVQRPVLICG